MKKTLILEKCVDPIRDLNVNLYYQGQFGINNQGKVTMQNQKIEENKIGNSNNAQAKNLFGINSFN